MRFNTQQIHGGFGGDSHNACAVPTYTTASFKFNSVANASDLFNMRARGYVYSRNHNPTVDVFERRIAGLENGTTAVASSTGAAAVMMVTTALCKSGDNIVTTPFLYQGTYRQFHDQLPRLGVEVRFAKTEDAEVISSLIDTKTKFIYTESISNPTGHIADLETLAAAAKKAELPLVVDSTFGAGGYYIRPLDFGADIVIHSATKWICGHGTTLGGVVVDSGRFDWTSQSHKFPSLGELQKGLGPGLKAITLCVYLKSQVLDYLGSCMSPASAQQMLIGLETLSLRCERMASNAIALARWLQAHPQVGWVAHPSLESHESYRLAEKYLRNSGGSVLALKLKGRPELSHTLIDNLRLATHCTNVGDSKTLVISPWATADRVDENSREYCGISEGLVRVSVGTEDIEDLIEDFSSGLQAVSEAPAPQDIKVKMKTGVRQN